MRLAGSGPSLLYGLKVLHQRILVFIRIIIISTFKTCVHVILTVNPKIFVAAAVGVFAVILGIITISGESFIGDIPSAGIPGTASEVIPVEISLEDISITEVSDRAATIEVSFSLVNPNEKSVILQFVKYELYADGVRIHTGEIGERPEGMVQFSSNYYTLLTNKPIVLTDTISISNSGRVPELWAALESGTVDFDIKGNAFFNLSSITAGGENEITFEFD